MYLFLSSQIYEDCGVGFDIKFWFIDNMGVIGVDSEQYDTYFSCLEIEDQAPSNYFDFYNYRGDFRVASISEIIDKNYLSYIDGYMEVDDAWRSGLKFNDYVKKCITLEILMKRMISSQKQ